MVYERLARDGFTRLGENWGTQRNLGTRKLQVACEGDDGWGRQFSRRHPLLKLRYAGYLEHGYTFAFWLDEYPELLAGASWANWDCNGCLWVARPGGQFSGAPPGRCFPIRVETIGWKKLSLARCREMSPTITSDRPRISGRWPQPQRPGG